MYSTLFFRRRPGSPRSAPPASAPRLALLGALGPARLRLALGVARGAALEPRLYFLANGGAEAREPGADLGKSASGALNGLGRAQRRAARF